MRDANTEVAETPDVGYERGLSARTVQMIAIGGAIGTGLFYGAGGAIEKAGPALILAYLLAGLAVFVIMRALGELLVYRPVSGSISEYAEEFMGRFAGFANGKTDRVDTAFQGKCTSSVLRKGFCCFSWPRPAQRTRPSSRTVFFVRL